MTTRLPNIDIPTLVSRYDAILLDAYGVLVDGSRALPGAATLIAHLDRIQKPYLILTNDASKLPSTATARYHRMGLPLDPDRFVTSGSLLVSYFQKSGLVGARCFVLGPEDSHRYVELAGGEVLPFDVTDPRAVDAIVIGDESGYPFLEGVDRALSFLFAKVDAGEPLALVCPNPDVVFPAAEGQFGFASGSVALLLEAAARLRYPARDDLGFVRLGKPNASIYEAALARTGTRNMVMVGDQLETDIRGALAFGLDAVLVSGGVTARLGAELPPEITPTYVLPSIDSGLVSG